jgi:chromosome segregation ATPase
MSPQDEKKLLANIKRLKEQIPNAERLGELAPLIKQLNDQKKPIYDEIKVIKAQLEEKSKELDAVRQEQTEVKEKNNDLTEQLNKLNEAIEKQKADLQEIYNRKDQLREDYHHARYDFEVENAQIKHFEHLARVKEGLVARNKDKQERLAARQQALADRPNPCQKELDTCERLIAYV